MNTLDVQKYGAAVKKILIVDDYDRNAFSWWIAHPGGYMQITQAGTVSRHRPVRGRRLRFVSRRHDEGDGRLELLKGFGNRSHHAVILITAHPERKWPFRRSRRDEGFFPNPQDRRTFSSGEHLLWKERFVEGVADGTSISEKLSELDGKATSTIPSRIPQATTKRSFRKS
jgi:hypothetical protein